MQSSVEDCSNNCRIFFKNQTDRSPQENTRGITRGYYNFSLHRENLEKAEADLAAYKPRRCDK
jgi:hypothetical protein